MTDEMMESSRYRTSEWGGSDNTGLPSSHLNLNALVRPSIVKVSGESFDRYHNPITVTGSGFFFTRDGELATDRHVVDGVTNLKVVTEDGTTYNGHVEKVDRRTDVAILRVDGVPRDVAFTPLRFAGSGINQPAGEAVAAFGHPEGDNKLYRSNGSLWGIERAYQIHITSDVSMEDPNRFLIDVGMMTLPGNSGGPVVDEQGEVIGLVKASDSNGRTVATPVDYLKNLVAGSGDSLPQSQTTTSQAPGEGYSTPEVEVSESPTPEPEQTAIAQDPPSSAEPAGPLLGPNYMPTFTGGGDQSYSMYSTQIYQPDDISPEQDDQSGDTYITQVYGPAEGNSNQYIQPWSRYQLPAANYLGFSGFRQYWTPTGSSMQPERSSPGFIAQRDYHGSFQYYCGGPVSRGDMLEAMQALLNALRSMRMGVDPRGC